MHKAQDRQGSKIGVVNGLRGIAILMVVLHHLFIPYAGPNPLHAGEMNPGSIFSLFIADAWLGVNVFFVLSGFVLYLPYRFGRRAITSLGDFGTFYRHRAQRLLPLYYIVALISLTLHAQAAVGSRNWYLELGGLLSTLFIFSPHGFMPPSNIVLWSVGVEIWFSLLFPAIVLAVHRWGIERVVLGVLAASMVFVIAGGLIPIERTGSFRPFSMGIFGACYQFVLGMYVCDLYVRHSTQPTPPAWVWTLVAGLTIGGTGFYLMHHESQLLMRVVSQLMIVTGIASLLYALLFAARPLQMIFENWALQLLGCMCYSIYAWHGIVMNTMIPPATSFLADTLRLMTPFAVLIMGLSALSYRYIEFGHVRDWRGLFLLPDRAVGGQFVSTAKTAPAVAAPVEAAELEG